MARARRAIRQPLSHRLARARIPQIAAAGVTIALLGGAVGAEARLSTAIPAEVVTPVAGSVDTAAVTDLAALVGAADRADRAAEEKASRSATTRPDAKKSDAKKSDAKKSDSKKEAGRATRSSDRDAARGAVIGTRWTTAGVNLRTSPSTSAAVRTTLAVGAKVAITDATEGSFQQVAVDGRTGWVHADYLSKKKPSVQSSAANGSAGSAVSGGVCASGSAVESGLQPNAIKVHRAICAQFPQITSYGGVRADSIPGHPDGRAIDAMIPNYSSAGGNALGWQIARWVRANASSLGVTEVIFDQQIWTTQRGSEGWRTMSNRGGATANHRDHVHVTVR